MNKENILFGIIGLLLGCIGGFVFANTVNQRGYDPAPAAAASPTPELPADHPPIDQGNQVLPPGTSTDSRPAEVQAKKANDEPANFDAQMDAAKEYYRIRRLPQSIEFLQKAIKLRPREFEALAAMGNAQFDSGNFTEAERWYREALVVRPNSVEVRTDLGSTFLQRTPPDPARAIQEYQASLKFDPNHEPTLGNLVRAYALQKNFAEAQSMLDRLAKVNPGNPDLPAMRTELQRMNSN
ncbi:MAG: tetratricopeptide repeat protein [Pyrinomonadaceae bacterium]